jgi:hypothetical protein
MNAPTSLPLDPITAIAIIVGCIVVTMISNHFHKVRQTRYLMSLSDEHLEFLRKDADDMFEDTGPYDAEQERRRLLAEALTPTETEEV